MIDLKLIEHTNNVMPKMSKKILEGLPMHDLQTVESYINTIIRCAEESFNPRIKYVGYRRCTPMEQFTEITKPSTPVRTYDMNRSDVYLVKYSFRFDNIDLVPRYIFLPFVSQGGLIYLRGTQYSLASIIGSSVFNVEKGNIYMRTPRIPFGFFRQDITCVLNSKVIYTSLVGSYLFHVSKPVVRSPLKPTLVHYMLAECGLQGMLKTVFNLDSVIGNEEVDKLQDEGYMVYMSRQLPLKIGRVTANEVCNIRIAIPIDQYNPLFDCVIGSIFYIMDNCVESTKDVNDLNEPRLWLRLLSRFIFKVQNGEKKIFDQMESHLQGIKASIDTYTRKVLLNAKVTNNGKPIMDVFELFKYVYLNYQDIIIHYDVGTMYDKELSTIKAFLYHVVENIFNTMYELARLPENLLNEKKLNQVLIHTLKNNKIFNTANHGELTSASPASDCIIYSTAGNILSHNKATSIGSKQKNVSVINDPGTLLHSSQAEVATYPWIGGSDSTGRGKINPFAKFSRGTTIERNPLHSKDIAAIDKLLKHNTNSN